MSGAVRDCIFVCGLSLCSGGCGFGLFVPEPQEFYQNKAEEKADENVIVGQIKCELQLGTQRVKDAFGFDKRDGNVAWFHDYVAKVTLKLTLDEKSSVAPGISYVKLLPNAIVNFPGAVAGSVSRMFSATASASLSADAQRIETLGFTYKLGDLVDKKPPIDKCDNENGILIHSDLKIAEFMINKAFIASVPGQVRAPDKKPVQNKTTPYNAFNYEVSFAIVYGGNITPTWKFVRITADPSSSFFMASRSRTHDVTITLGPPDRTSDTPQLSAEAQAIHNAALIGQAVAAALQGTGVGH